MNDTLKRMIVGAVSGFVSAFLVDLNAWLKSGEDTKFDYVLAIKRWVAGAVSGLGLGGL
jgi:uncharacterized protein YgfB (UPF0149 family)